MADPKEKDNLLTETEETETEETKEEITETEEPEIPEWRKNLPEGIRENPILDKFNSLEDVAKSYIEAQKFIGRKKIPLPPENATKEDWDVVFKSLGRPEKAEDYKIPEIKDLPEDFEISNEMVENFKEEAHKLGLLPPQVEGLYKWYVDTQKNFIEHYNELREEDRANAEANLRKEWGKAYGQNLGFAQKVMKQFADEDAVTEIEESLGNNPALIKMFYNIGKTMSEDVLAGAGERRFTKTPEEARQEILRIKSDLKHPLHDEFHPEHKQALEYMESLYKMAYPELTK